MDYSLSFQDLENIRFAEEVLEKAKKKDYKKVKGLRDWVGRVGFNACVSKLSGKSDITDAKAVCGALKREARKAGTLAKEHMGRKEKQSKKGKK